MLRHQQQAQNAIFHKEIFKYSTLIVLYRTRFLESKVLSIFPINSLVKLHILSDMTTLASNPNCLNKEFIFSPLSFLTSVTNFLPVIIENIVP